VPNGKTQRSPLRMLSTEFTVSSGVTDERANFRPRRSWARKCPVWQGRGIDAQGEVTGACLPVCVEVLYEMVVKEYPRGLSFWVLA